MPSQTTATSALSRPVFLLGMMGAGKSCVGRELADMAGAVFIDLDTRIERMVGRPISALFELGEAYFRACERSALVSLCDEPGFAGANAVVATGGGIVVDPANIGTMVAMGEQVYLEVSVETLAKRLSTPHERQHRPLLADEPDSLARRLQELLGARQRDYRSAGHRVDGEPEPRAVATAVLRVLGSNTTSLP